MALAAAVVGPPLWWLCSGLGSSWLPQCASRRGSDRCECPNRPLASSRALLRGCGAPISQHLQRRAMRCVFPLRQPSSGLPGSPEDCKESWDACRARDFHTLGCVSDTQSHFTLRDEREEQPRKMARLTAALCLSCASAMSYHNPVKAPQRTGTSFLPVKLQSGNSKETNQNSSHARIAREARSATL